MDNLAYIEYCESLRQRIKHYIDHFAMTLAQFSRIAGVRRRTTDFFMNKTHATVRADVAALYEVALIQTADVTCDVCKMPLPITHFCLSPQQKDGECIACCRTRIDGKAAHKVKVEAKPAKVVEPGPVKITVDDARVMPREAAKPSTINGIAQDKAWFQDFFGVTFVPRDPEPERPERAQVVDYDVSRQNVARRAA